MPTTRNRGLNIKGFEVTPRDNLDLVAKEIALGFLACGRLTSDHLPILAKLDSILRKHASPSQGRAAVDHFYVNCHRTREVLAQVIASGFLACGRLGMATFLEGTASTPDPYGQRLKQEDAVEAAVQDFAKDLLVAFEAHLTVEKK